MKYSKYLLGIVFLFLFFNVGSPLHALKKSQFSPLRKPNNGGVYVIAHRGAHNGIPENSLAAYQKAIDLGCDFVEIDVRTTRDGKFISMHNSTIDSYVSGKTGNISDLPLAEMRALDIGSRIGPEWKDTRVPTFEEILQLCRGKIGIYLDLKAASVPALVEIIKKYGMERDILWYLEASRMKEIKEIAACCPECIPMPDPGPESNIDALMSQFPAKALATDLGELSEKFVNKAHQYHARVTVDDKEGTEKEWNQILDWKTDGIQTNWPEKLIPFLKKQIKQTAKNQT